MQKSKLLRAGIPGENLTVNGKNYPWHRPPQYAEFDDAYEWFSDEVLGDAERLSNISIVLNNGISALAITQSILVQAVGAGKISPDMSLLIAGPVYKTLTRMMDMVGVRYLTGYDTAEEISEFTEYMKSGQFMSSTKGKKLKLSKEQEAEMDRITSEIEAEIPEGGLMGAQNNKDKMDIPMDASEKGLVTAQDSEEDKA